MTTSRTSDRTVTVVGAGALGVAIAGRLGTTGHTVRLWNRHAQRAEEAADGLAGVQATADLGEAVRDAAAVITVLRDGEATADTMGSVLDELTGVWIQTGTVGPDAAARLADQAAEHGVAYLDAPVSGSTGPAENGELVWLVAGSDDAVTRARPVLDDLGKTVQVVGTRNEGSALKLAVNAWMSATTVVMSDVLDLCDALHVPHDTLRAALEAGPLAMPYALQKSQVMDGDDLSPGFAVNLALKDLRLAADAEQPSSVLRAVTERLQHTVDAGHGDDDLAAVSRTR
jgi:3-hydroxyisobutyrate dehydrogenase